MRFYVCWYWASRRGSAIQNSSDEVWLLRCVMEFLGVLTFVLIPSEETKSKARLSGHGQGVTPLIELFLIFWFLVQECRSSKCVFKELLIWCRISFSSLVCKVLNLFSRQPEFLGTPAHIVSRFFLSESLRCYADLTKGIIFIMIRGQIPTKETLLPKWLWCHGKSLQPANWVQKKYVVTG